MVPGQNLAWAALIVENCALLGNPRLDSRDAIGRGDGGRGAADDSPCGGNASRRARKAVYAREFCRQEVASPWAFLYFAGQGWLARGCSMGSSPGEGDKTILPEGTAAISIESRNRSLAHFGVRGAAQEANVVPFGLDLCMLKMSAI